MPRALGKDLGSKRPFGREWHYDPPDRSWSRRREGEARSNPTALMAAWLMALSTDVLGIQLYVPMICKR